VSLVKILMKGATEEALEEGLELLQDNLDIDIQADLDEAHFLHIFASNKEDSSEAPPNFDVVQRNAIKVIPLLKPAHILYKYHNLIEEAFNSITDELRELTMESYQYEDFRKYCAGMKEIVSASGEVLGDRSYFIDATVSFEGVQKGSILEITSGANSGTYEVAEVLRFPLANDATAQTYTTSPTGLSGTAIVQDNVIVDTNQDFASIVENEILTFSTGQNTGSYRIHKLIGEGGGVVGEVSSGSFTQVRPSLGVLRLTTRCPQSLNNQPYRVSLDRLGVKTPNEVTNEDISQYFVL
jgi:hypothetical protein